MGLLFILHQNIYCFPFVLRIAWFLLIVLECIYWVKMVAALLSFKRCGNWPLDYGGLQQNDNGFDLG